MIQFEVAKFGFRIRTKTGGTVDHLCIHARDHDEACRKLRQIYRGCEILETWTEKAQLRPLGNSFEDVVDLITPPH